MLEWTGERYLPFVDPKISGTEIHYEHLHRYCFASRFVKGKKVLDLGCGEGYGSDILSELAENVIGIDIDEKAIEHASSKYVKKNLKFIRGSAFEVPIKSENSFDVIICFEILEHVEEHNKLLSEVKRLLKADGVLVISTPNKKVYSDEANYKNPFHKKELYFSEFKELLKAYLNHVYFFGQRVYAGSRLCSLARVNDISEEYLVERRKSGFAITDHETKEPMYFIAIVSDNEIDASKLTPRSYLTDVDSTVFHDSRSLETEKTRLAEELDKARNELSMIKESLGYQFMRFCAKKIDRLFPEGRRRGRLRKAIAASLQIAARERLCRSLRQA